MGGSVSESMRGRTKRRWTTKKSTYSSACLLPMGGGIRQKNGAGANNTERWLEKKVGTSKRQRNEQEPSDQDVLKVEKKESRKSKHDGTSCEEQPTGVGGPA